MKTYTETEVILRERAAFERGYHTNFAGEYRPGQRGVYIPGAVGTAGEGARFAAKKYPLPKTTRPRIWTDPWGSGAGRQFRVIDNQVQTRDPDAVDDQWYCLDNGSAAATDMEAGMMWPVHRVLAIADLINRPTEEVDAE